jgi:hypothetical protein
MASLKLRESLSILIAYFFAIIFSANLKQGQRYQILLSSAATSFFDTPHTFTSPPRRDWSEEMFAWHFHGYFFFLRYPYF